jgi:hypothetical protein
MNGSELISKCKKVFVVPDSTEWCSFHKIPDFHVAIVWKGCFLVHFFGNAPIYASTVLECSCCKIHRYVAAPATVLLHIGGSCISCDYGPFISKSLVKQRLRHKAVRAATFLGHPRPLLSIAFEFHRSFQTFSCWESCSLSFVFSNASAQPPSLTLQGQFRYVQCNRSSRYLTFSNLKSQQRPLRCIIGSRFHWLL